MKVSACKCGHSLTLHETSMFLSDDYTTDVGRCRVGFCDCKEFRPEATKMIGSMKECPDCNRGYRFADVCSTCNGKGYVCAPVPDLAVCIDDLEVIKAITCRHWGPGMSLLIQPWVNGFGVTYIRLDPADGFHSCDRCVSTLEEAADLVRLSSLQQIKVDKGWPERNTDKGA